MAPKRSRNTKEKHSESREEKKRRKEVLQVGETLRIGDELVESEEDDEDYAPSDPEASTTQTQHPTSTPQQSSSSSSTNESVEDPIWKRTRAHLSLENIDLEQLEAFLQEEAPASPLKTLNEEEAEKEYRNFLLMLQSGELPDDENDTDYTLNEDASSSNNMKFDSEEYRNDRGVQVPRQEVAALIEDAENITNGLSSFDNTLLPLSTLQSAASSNNRKKRQVTRRIAMSSNVSNLKPIRPLIQASAPSLFSSEQLVQLKNQMQIHFQLLAQVFLLSRVNLCLSNVEQESNREIIVDSWTMMNDLNAQRESFLLKQALNPQFNPNATSAFDIPSLALLPSLYEFTTRDTTPSIHSMNAILTQFQPYFNPYFNIDLCNANPRGTKTRFTENEDKLLASGLERFGTGNWGLIQRYFLPTKTERQIANRYKNLSASHSADNAIKAYRLSRAKPLTSQEERILCEAVRLYGLQWDKIAEKFFPQKSPKELEKHYQDIYKRGAKAQRTRSRKKYPTRQQQYSPQPAQQLQPRQMITAIRRDTQQNSTPKEHCNINENFLRVKPKPKAPQQQTQRQVHNQQQQQNQQQENVAAVAPASSPEMTIQGIVSSEPVLDLSTGSFEEVDLADSSDDESGSSGYNSDETMLHNPFAVMCIKWTKEEDRHILFSAKTHGASLATWNQIVRDGLVEKTVEQVADRYSQLLALFKIQNRDV